MKTVRAGKKSPDVGLRETMAQSRLSPSTWDYSDGTGGGGGGGGRRNKMFGYLKAANELRQTYTAQWTGQISSFRSGYGDDYFHTPGAFSDVEIARADDEEMVIFPSYARRLVKGREHHWHPPPPLRRDSDSSTDDYYKSSEELERERLDYEAEKREIENSVVDVDVRGWIYAPHRGPMNRKNRLMVALARKLSGVPAPNANPGDNAGSNQDQGPPGKAAGKMDDEAVNQEIHSIISKAERDADQEWKGVASDNQGEGAAGPLPRSTTSTPDPSTLSRDELSMANAHLMERLQPFLSNPMPELPVTAFFFNDEKSQSRNISTDESGHFSLRVGLPFVPTHVRVLASEKLSGAKKIEIIEPTGVSLISDIDDTVKHSAIASGAKEIFRNTFVRALEELTVDGVAEWYSSLLKMGVEFHYVSNAPWQLYPLLERYFKLVGLPPGSFHLKQYSGMLQGIFEPTAERKKSSLERILNDFPDRKFILVGDSGEADLEVYTDTVLAHPGRILGIFIRDITTPDKKKFFEKSVEHLESGPKRSRTTGQLVASSDSPASRSAPALPPRRPREGSDLSEVKSLDDTDLIDLRDEDQKSAPETKPANPRVPPAKPAKPSTLRTVSTPDGEGGSSPQEAIARKAIPPLPPRRGSSAVETRSGERSSQTGSGQSTPMEGYMAPVKNAVSTVSSALPAAAEYLPIPNLTGSKPAEGKKQPPPVPPPRRANAGTSTPNSSGSGPQVQRQQSSSPLSAASAALQYASDRLPSTPLRSPASNSSLSRTNTNSDDSNGLDYGALPAPLPNKREELWRRRWERANEILQQKGVVLGSWRVGKDVQDVCMWLAEEAIKDIKNQPKK